MKCRSVLFAVAVLMICFTATAAHTDYLPGYLLSSFSVMDAVVKDDPSLLEDGTILKVMDEGRSVQIFSKDDLTNDGEGYGWMLLVNRMNFERPLLVEIGNHENVYALFLSGDMLHEFRITESDGLLEIAVSKNHASGLTNYMSVKHDLLITRHELSFSASRRDITKPGEALEVIGQVKNISGRDLENLTLTVIFMDKDKKIVAESAGVILTEVLRHAERTAFSASIEYDPAIESAALLFRNANGDIMAVFPAYID